MKPTLGQIIRFRRKEKEWTGIELSKQIHKLRNNVSMSSPHLCLIEKGLRRPSHKLLQALIRVLELDREQVYIAYGDATNEALGR